MLVSLSSSFADAPLHLLCLREQVGCLSGRFRSRSLQWEPRSVVSLVRTDRRLTTSKCSNVFSRLNVSDSNFTVLFYSFGFGIFLGFVNTEAMMNDPCKYSLRRRCFKFKKFIQKLCRKFITHLYCTRLNVFNQNVRRLYMEHKENERGRESTKLFFNSIRKFPW